CGRRWGCWEQVPIDPPYPLRSAGLVLPPADPRLDVSYFCCAYPELETPAARLLSDPPRNPVVLARAGVGLFVRPNTKQLVRLAPQGIRLCRQPDELQITVELDG